MKILFCGLGSVGQRHLRNVRTLLGDQVEILAYRARGNSPVLNPDMSVRSGADLETTYQLRSFTRLEDALNENPDVAFVTNPNALHLPVALAAARSGCHLFIEKPLSDSLDGTNELVTEVENHHLVAFVAYQFRFHPGLRWVKQLITEGKLGNLVSAHIVNGEYLPGWHPYEDYRGTHPTQKALGGGCLRIQTHELDYAMWLFGRPNRVYTVGGHLSNLEVDDVEDSADILLTCQNNGHILPVHIHLDYLQRPPQRICEVIGDAGKVRYDYYANQVEFDDLATKTKQIFRFDNYERNLMFMDELKHFMACIRGEEMPGVNLHEGILSMKITSAAAESLSSGQSVEILYDR